MNYVKLKEALETGFYNASKRLIMEYSKTSVAPKLIEMEDDEPETLQEKKPDYLSNWKKKMLERGVK